MTNSTPSTSVELRNVSKMFGNSGRNAVDDVTLEIAGGEFMTFLGPSGSGKTTTLNAIAGFTSITSGTILIGGDSVANVPTHKRDIGMVFQHYALFPHMGVLANVMFPLLRRGDTKPVALRKAREALASVALSEYESRFPKQLSGGQQQRVAVARAVVYSPRVLLMDEPLGALDKRLREHLQGEIARLHRDLGLTFIYVTHDQEEALALSDRIAVFNEGRIEQVGTASDLYERPSTKFVANFVGESTILTGARRGNHFLTKAGVSLPLPATSLARVTGGSIMVRPEHIQISKSPVQDGPRLQGTVVDVVYLGSATKFSIALEGGDSAIVRQHSDTRTENRIGDLVEITWDPEKSVLLPSD